MFTYLDLYKSFYQIDFEIQAYKVKTEKTINYESEIRELELIKRKCFPNL